MDQDGSDIIPPTGIVGRLDQFLAGTPERWRGQDQGA
jgi:hypothetical protein